MPMDRSDVLHAEHDRVGGTIKDHYLALHQVIALSLLIFAAGAAFVSSPIGAILTPVAIALVALYGLDLLRSMMALSGYKAWIEEQFGSETKSSDLVWDSGISMVVNTNSWGKRAVFALYGLVVLSGALVSIVSAVRYDGEFASYVEVAVLAFWPVYLVLASVSAAEGLRAKEAAHQRAADICGRTND